MNNFNFGAFRYYVAPQKVKSNKRSISNDKNQRDSSHDNPLIRSTQQLSAVPDYATSATDKININTKEDKNGVEESSEKEIELM